MIFIVHHKAREVVEVFRNSEQITSSADLCKTFWKLAGEFPEELIVWVDKDLFPLLKKEKLEDRFVHDLVMSSYAVKTKFLSGQIGYVDQLPFINVNSEVKYPTWRMSSDVGGIKGKVLLKFRSVFGKISDFDYLLNSIAKLGQQNGLFCYSDPQLMNTVQQSKLYPSAGNRELFSFVYQHYKGIWIFILFFCLVKYEKRFPVAAFLQAVLKRKFFKKTVDLIEIQEYQNNCERNAQASVDVIIPTIGRAQYVRQVVEDLSFQSLLPKKVIIVEQQPDKNAESELQDLLAKEWPFEIIHLFTRQTGACMARNMALDEIASEWIFFADDDIRLEGKILEKTIKEAGRLKVSCINLNCKQTGEKTVFHKIKQWGSFGSGTSMVRGQFAEKLRFSKAFEHGYGEDVDYGMKLRGAGCDIVYHPDLVIQHLKAQAGGFRKKPILAWEKEHPVLKPSPTVMLFAKKYYSQRQMKGFKISLYLKFFSKQKEKNPFAYIKFMERNWKRSQEWALRLQTESQAEEINRSY